MNVFFLAPAVNLDLWVNYGIASLCGVITDRGHAVDLFQPIRFDRKRLVHEFGKKEYSLCLVSAVTNQWPYALAYIRELRKISGIKIVVGGHHATSCPSILEDYPEIDAVCLGEGDNAVQELLENITAGQETTTIRNMWFRKDGAVVRNGIGDLIEDLDALPFPDFSVFSEKALSNRPSILLSRGCPYNCTYCCNNNLRRLYAGKGSYIRKKSVARAIEEVRRFIGQYHPRELNFDDDTFIKDKEWLYAFLEEYRKITNIPFNCNSRPETINDEVCMRLKEAGCEVLCIGIENGSEEFRKKHFKRAMSNDAIITAFRLLRKHGIRSYAFNIVGAPDETYDDYLDTVRLNRVIQPDDSQITIFYPYPGSELYNYAMEKGYLRTPEFRDSFISRTLLRMKQFPAWKISFAAFFFKYRLWIYKKSFFKKIAYLPVYIALEYRYRMTTSLRRMLAR